MKIPDCLYNQITFTKKDLVTLQLQLAQNQGARFALNSKHIILGVHITKKLSWSKHTKTVVKRSTTTLFPPQET
jgi:hypothetical protein